MAWSNLPVPWAELQARLRGDLPPDGNDGPAFSRKRGSYQPPSLPLPPVSAVPYAELHMHSNFSFLDGASHPETLVEEAARLGIQAVALTDHNGLYGVVRFAQAARQLGVATIFGAELSIGMQHQAAGVADPSGEHLLVLARGTDGYRRLSNAIAQSQLAGAKGLPQFDTIEQLGACAAEQWTVLTGCRKSPVVRALLDHGPTAARRALQRLVSAFGRDQVAVELWDHGDPLDGHRNDALVELAASARLPVVVSNNVHYARPTDFRLATVMAAIRARSSLDALDGWLPVSPAAHLRSGAEQQRRFRRYPGVIEATVDLANELQFDLQLVAPDLPQFSVPDGHTSMSWLRHLVEAQAPHRYGIRERPTITGAWEQLDKELRIIEQLGYPGYFLIVYDIVQFCVRNNILCQGRGSAANSAVCYVLGITKADAVQLGLLFERFLSPQRDGPPDIDLDIESSRREEVIQYVYRTYGRNYAAQVANVITYRSRSAFRDVGRAFGYTPQVVDRWAKQLSMMRSSDVAPSDETVDIPADVVEYATQLIGMPRHLGLHSGGMVLCDRPIIDVCPIERARMPNRTVLQWDKDDCADVGLVKFDLLGLGMLSALHDMIDLVEAFYGVPIDLAELPQEDAVYDMLCAADAVGVFQVESRAQLATLPRLRPRTFYDLVVEVAIIRPGPIQGGSVHPYIRRRNGEEPVTFLHPLLENSLRRTLGVPLFQEQLMQMAVDVAGLTAAESDQLRQAMSAKRSTERMRRLQQRLFDGMEQRKIPRAIAERIYQQIEAFADFGFPESHAVSFAYLVYASAWMKLHYPAVFLVGLLNNQPMGFYSPQSLVADARRHGVVVARPDVNCSEPHATLHRTDQRVVVQLGLTQVKNVGDDLADRIAQHRPYATVEALVKCTNASKRAVESLATAGAFRSLPAINTDRRRALWIAGAAAEQGADRLPGTAVGMQAPELPSMSAVDHMVADIIATGISPESYPTEFIRDDLIRRGVLSAAEAAQTAHGRQIRVAGVVTHRQRPATASGTVFMNLEDETGMTNVICSPGFWAANVRVATTASAVIITGRVERFSTAVSVVAQHIEPLELAASASSRNFR